MKNCIFLFLAVLIAGCTSVTVHEIHPSHQLSHVCIKDNPKVIVEDFLPVVIEGFERHGITTEVYQGGKPGHCRYHLTYTALKAWDLVTYMHHAELQLYQGVEPIASAEYHLNGKGGLALTKFDSVANKMNPVIDKLLANYTPEMVDVYRKPIIKSTSSTSENFSKPQKLRELKKWLDEGLITEQDYNAEKQKVLSQ